MYVVRRNTQGLAAVNELAITGSRELGTGKRVGVRAGMQVAALAVAEQGSYIRGRAVGTKNYVHVVASRRVLGYSGTHGKQFIVLMRNEGEYGLANWINLAVTPCNSKGLSRLDLNGRWQRRNTAKDIAVHRTLLIGIQNAKGSFIQSGGKQQDTRLGAEKRA